MSISPEKGSGMANVIDILALLWYKPRQEDNTVTFDDRNRLLRNKNSNLNNSALVFDILTGTSFVEVTGTYLVDELGLNEVLPRQTMNTRPTHLFVRALDDCAAPFKDGGNYCFPAGDETPKLKPCEQPLIGSKVGGSGPISRFIRYKDEKLTFGTNTPIVPLVTYESEGDVTTGRILLESGQGYNLPTPLAVHEGRYTIISPNNPPEIASYHTNTILAQARVLPISQVYYAVTYGKAQNLPVSREELQLVVYVIIRVTGDDSITIGPGYQWFTIEQLKEECGDRWESLLERRKSLHTGLRLVAHYRFAKWGKFLPS